MNFLLRRRGLGHTSCTEVSKLSQTGIQVVRNDANPIPEGETVFRWGCTSNVRAKTIVNTARAIHWVTDKRSSRYILAGAGLAPKTWLDVDNKGIEFPCVVRPAVHSQGKEVYLCKNREELGDAWDQVGGDGYISTFIDKVAEFRIYPVSGRVAAVANKIPEDKNAVAWNHAQGGKFENVRWGNWPLEAIKVSLAAFELSELDFGGVDVMVDKDGNAYVLEINSAPSLTSPYRQSCFAKCFDYIVTNGKDKLEVGKRGGYTAYIHPAINKG